MKEKNNGNGTENIEVKKKKGRKNGKRRKKKTQKRKNEKDKEGIKRPAKSFPQKGLHIKLTVDE